MDSVRRSRRASGASAGRGAELRVTIARSASETTPAVSAGRGNDSPGSGKGSNASYAQARRYRGGA